MGGKLFIINALSLIWVKKRYISTFVYSTIATISKKPTTHNKHAEPYRK
jgi:hypothetical protein